MPDVNRPVSPASARISHSPNDSANQYPRRTVAGVGSTLLGLAMSFFLLMGSAVADTLPAGAHPRFLLGQAHAGLVANWAAHKPAIVRIVAKCDAQAGQSIPSGYQGWDWLEQMADCAVAWNATGDPARAAQAVTYWRALVDDKTNVGDGMGGVGTGPGGQFIACQDSGYSMRTYGAYSALGLDWLHDAPGVDAALRARAIAHIDAWGNWYENGSAACTTNPQGGYLNTTPTGNYFAGYFFATWAGAIAVGNDDPVVGQRLWTRARKLTETMLIPALGTTLAGGDQFEGWQYGDVTAAEYALSSAGAAQNGYTAFANTYMHDTIAFHMYALHPGGTRFFDAGDQSQRPVTPNSDAMWAALIANPTDAYAPYARHYLAIASPGGPDVWSGAVAEALSPSWPSADWTTAGLPLSYFAKGTGTVLARSGWGDNDIWTSFQSAGRGTPDHQHCDAGHFELVRGADDLAVTTADYGTYATWNNNTLLFDDGGAQLSYAPNQGPDASPSQVGITRYAELGGAVGATGDFAPAYANSNGGNSVTMARRDLVFVRPDLLVINDRTAVTKPTVKVTWPLHTLVAPTRGTNLLTADIGASRLTSHTLVPSSMTSSLVTEPSANAGPAPWLNNDPWTKSTLRAEESVSGASTQAFLHTVVAGASGQAAPASSVVTSGGANIVTVAGNPSRVVVLSAAADGSDIALPFTYQAPAGKSEHVLFGLSAAAGYQITITSSCSVTIAAGSDPRVTSGDHAAFFTLDACGSATLPPDMGGSQMVDGSVPVGSVDMGATPLVDGSVPSQSADLAGSVVPPTVDGGVSVDGAVGVPVYGVDAGTGVVVANGPGAGNPGNLQSGCSVSGYGAASGPATGTLILFALCAALEIARRRRARVAARV